MDMKAIRSGLFAVMMAGGAFAATSTGSSSWSAYTVSGTDLLQTHLGSIVDELIVNTVENNSWSFGTTATLTDGTAGDANASQSLCLSGGSVTYVLNTALSPAGYDISSVDTYSGWRDVGRVNQHCEVSFRKVGSGTFGDVITVDYGAGASQTRVNMAAVNLTGVDAVRFTFLDQQNGGVGYKELDVFGTPSAPARTVTGESGGSVYAVSSTDLLQSHLGSTDNALSLYNEGGYDNGGVAALTDGSFGSDSKAGSCGIAGGSVTYTLNTADHPAGYAVTAIDTYSGWSDSGREDQNYTVSFRKVGSSLFSTPITVAYASANSQIHVNIAGLNLTGVDAVRFTFTAQENGGVGYKELDVIGSAPAYADVTRRDSGPQTITSNDTSNVRIIEGTGTPGANLLGAATTVIDSLTQSAPDGLATIDPAGQTLALNGIYLTSAAGGLAIGSGSANGTLKSAGTVISVDNVSANGVTVNSVIANGTGATELIKFGTGMLTLNAANTYSGGTAVNAGTLRIAGGTLGTGAVSVKGGTLQIDGGAVAPAGSLCFENSTVNQTAGSLSFNGYARVSDATLNLSGGASGIAQDNLLGWTGANATVHIGGSHVADWLVTRFAGGVAAVNLESGGSLYCDQLYSAGATGTIRFDGGKLGMSSRNPGLSPNDWISAAAGSLSLLVGNGGAVIDTANGSAAINRPLLRDGASAGGLTKTGANTLTLAALSTDVLSTYAGDTLVQGGTLKLSQVMVSLAIVNAGFEQPIPVADGWSALLSDGVPGGWVWVYSDPNSTDKGGIAVNNSPWVNTAPQGTQVCFIQGASEVKQTIAVPAAGTYRLAFSAANRPGHVGDNLDVRIDGVTVGFWSADAFNNGGAFKSYTATVTLSPGSHELKFVGTSPGGDTATTIDDVKLLRVDGDFPGSLPAGSRLAVSAGALLDLNGASQTVAELSGGGWVMNSSTTNAIFTFGGDNASTTFSGIIEGPVSLVKTGTGTMTLSGANLYTGSTVVNGGTLALDFPSIGPAAYATANAYSFTPAAGNLLAGLSPTDVSNGAAGIEGTGPVTRLTDGTIVADNANTYTIGNNAVLTYTLDTARGGYNLTQINIYGGWNDSGRENISLAGISYSTVAAPATFIPIANSAVNYEGNTAIARASLTASSGVLAANVSAVRFTFGAQENGYVGYRELEVIGSRSVLPAGTMATVAPGAVLDLKGTHQDLAGLSGSGLVTNGTLAISGVIAPGGTNVIGTLTLAATTSLSGTLLMDVALGGSSDLLKVQGNLDLSGLALVIQDVDQMGGGSPYVIATCAPGGLTGRFTSANLGAKRTVFYNNAAGEVQLIGRGLMVIIN